MWNWVDMKCRESGTLNLSMYFVPVREVGIVRGEGEGEREKFHEVENKKLGSWFENARK